MSIFSCCFYLKTECEVNNWKDIKKSGKWMVNFYKELTHTYTPLMLKGKEMFSPHDLWNHLNSDVKKNITSPIFESKLRETDKFMLKIFVATQGTTNWKEVLDIYFDEHGNYKYHKDLSVDRKVQFADSVEINEYIPDNVAMEAILEGNYWYVYRKVKRNRECLGCIWDTNKWFRGDVSTLIKRCDNFSVRDEGENEVNVSGDVTFMSDNQVVGECRLNDGKFESIQISELKAVYCGTWDIYCKALGEKCIGRIYDGDTKQALYASWPVPTICEELYVKEINEDVLSSVSGNVDFYNGKTYLGYGHLNDGKFGKIENLVKGNAVNDFKMFVLDKFKYTGSKSVTSILSDISQKLNNGNIKESLSFLISNKYMNNIYDLTDKGKKLLDGVKLNVDTWERVVKESNDYRNEAYALLHYLAKESGGIEKTPADTESYRNSDIYGRTSGGFSGGMNFNRGPKLSVQGSQGQVYPQTIGNNVSSNYVTQQSAGDNPIPNAIKKLENSNYEGRTNTTTLLLNNDDRELLGWLKKNLNKIFDIAGKLSLIKDGKEKINLDAYVDPQGAVSGFFRDYIKDSSEKTKALGRMDKVGDLEEQLNILKRFLLRIKKKKEKAKKKNIIKRAAHKVKKVLLGDKSEAGKVKKCFKEVGKCIQDDNMDKLVEKMKILGWGNWNSANSIACNYCKENQTVSFINVVFGSFIGLKNTKNVIAACDGLKEGGVKGSSDPYVKIRKAIKAECLNGELNKNGLKECIKESFEKYVRIHNKEVVDNIYNFYKNCPWGATNNQQNS